MATSLMDTTGRRATHVRHDDANHEDEGRDRVLAHAQGSRENEMPKAKAMAEMIWMKWWISLLIGVCSAS